MTSIDRDGFTVPAVGRQAQSQRESIPSHKISSVGRDQVQGVYISEGHMRTLRIGRESQSLGAPRGTLGGAHIGFGKAVRDITKLQKTTTSRNKPGEFFAPRNEDVDDIPTNDALDVWPDSQQYKYLKDPSVVIGTEPRGKLKDATLLRNHAVAFYARCSPGPAAIGGEFGPQIGPTKPSIAPARTFGQKTKAQDWTKVGDNPEEIGPGRHDRRDTSFGIQHLSQRRTQSVHDFPHAKRFGNKSMDDQISLLQAARSSMGKQTLAKNRSAPSVGFAVDDRDKRSKTKVCITRNDEGPRASMPKFIARQPPIPVERTIMASGVG
mmetsp:Transcript_78311/g.162695  ORF Transcript_78311/g.162695 Transcript_78311/m.162695 type:complete len:323 (-) Transcript_78311:98-1066(-)